MKNISFLVICAIAVINKVSACIPDCWAEKLGYPCCIESDPKVVAVDEHGEWGIEDGKKCGILVWDHNLKCAPSTPEKKEYGKCENSDLCVNVKNVDEDGTIWGYDENLKQRCIMDTEDETCRENIKSTCWSALLGYKCCSGTPSEIFKDDNGLWGIEDDQWCGISYCPGCGKKVRSVDKYHLIWSYDKENDRNCIINTEKERCYVKMEISCRSALLGYMCCQEDKVIVTRDDFGFWGIENGKWCGYTERYPCAYYNSIGYECCVPDGSPYKKIYVESEGVYSTKNGKICGLLPVPFVDSE